MAVRPDQLTDGGAESRALIMIVVILVTVIAIMIVGVIRGRCFRFAWWFLMEQGSYPSSNMVAVEILAEPLKGFSTILSRFHSE